MPWALGLGITGGMFESSTLARLSVLIRRTTNKFRSARANVRVVQAGDGASFAVEAFAQLGTICKMRRQDFNGDNSIEASIMGFINLAHSARTDRGEYFVWP